MLEQPDGASLASVAAAARAEWRADEEEWTAAALEQWRHGRTIVDIAREHLHRGDIIAVELDGSLPGVRSGSRVLQGSVIGVADDAIALDTLSGRVDVALHPGASIAWRVVERVRDGGGRGLLLNSFRARLLELESAGQPVAVGATTVDMIHRGRLTVGRDHVVVDDDDAWWVIAFSALRWVRAVSPHPHLD
ncbi:MAG: hypothetical protein ABW033_09090 [Acidimicrobiia bacterium]